MTDEVKVRSATPSDASAVRAITERAIRLSAADLYSPAQVEAWASGGSDDDARFMIEHSSAFVAEIEGAVVGFANLVESEVDQLYVDPDFGGRGVARRLYAAVEIEARASGLAYLTTTASLRAEPAFAAFGFHPMAHVERQFNGQTFPVVVMRKDRITAPSLPIRALGDGRRRDPPAVQGEYEPTAAHAETQRVPPSR